MSVAPFRSVAYPVRLYAGEDALDHVATELARLGASRAFAVSGKSIVANTDVRDRLERLLGDRLAGWYAGIEKDSTYRSTRAAADEARDAGADLVVAVGGGSVIVSGRAVAIFLAEPGDPFEIMTQYPEGKPAYSPRLNAPKPPIINVVTTPTTAMNRAGTGLKNDDLDHRMEYFDPKTRPAALIWDEQVLLETPLPVFRSTSITTFSGAVSGIGTASDANPLVEGNRRQAFRLAWRALPRIADPTDGAARIDMVTASFLQNRSADDDVNPGPRPGGWGRTYAVSTALHLRYDQIGQGEATAVLTPAAMRLAPPPAQSLRQIAEAIGIEAPTAHAALAEAVASEYERHFRAAGMSTRLRDLGVAREDFSLIAGDTLKNFNANPGMRSDRQIEETLELLEAAW